MVNSCLILEGGGLRGAFTGGVLEYFLENNLNFERVVGVSAGACLGASYVSRQKGRNWQVNVQYPSDKRYMGFRHLLTSGSYFNMPFIFGELPEKLVPFDEKTFYENPTAFDIVISSMRSGVAKVLTKNDTARIGLNKALVASSSIPLLSKHVTIDGEYFMDGGVADSIPVKYALSKHDKAVVVLTRPRGYRKEKLSNSFIYKMAFGSHPKFLDAILQRNEAYNMTLDFCDQMEREGKLFILAPSSEMMISRTEKKPEKREGLYRHGSACALEAFENIQKFLMTD